jgi:hypothetical protein
MINRYRRSARRASELGLGTLKPLDEAIPELRPEPGKVREASAASEEALVGGRDDSEKTESSPSSSRGRGRTGTPFRTADFETAGAVSNGVEPQDHWGFQATNEPDRAGPTFSEPLQTFSGGVRERLMAVLGLAAAEAMAEGDVEVARVANEAAAKLIAAPRPRPSGEVVMLRPVPSEGE